MKIQLIVEGQGDIDAAPVLIRRICYEMGRWLGARIAAPMKVPRSKMVQEAAVRHYIRIASSAPDCVLILFFIDADDDCAKELAEKVRPWIDREGLCIPCELIIIPREFECWFIAALESLRGVRGIRTDAESHPFPETVRNPKGIITEAMFGSAAYHETADQAALAETVDLHLVFDRCPSFRRLVSKLERYALCTE